MTQASNSDRALEAMAATATDAVRLIGPRGGFRILSFRYVDAQGVTVYVATSIREEAAALERLFAARGIAVRVEQLPPKPPKRNRIP